MIPHISTSYIQMQMRQSSPNRISIDPYYKNNVFERDQAYYSQMLAGARRSTSNLRNTNRQSSLQRHTDNDPLPPSQANQRVQIISKDEAVYLNNVGSNNKAYGQAMKTNMALNEQLKNLINGNTVFGNTQNVLKLSHYNANQNDLTKIKEQQVQIKRLESIIQANETKISNYKRAGEELSQRMLNIQSIDKEIYKTLQGSVNRDRELLDRAASALARGERREEVAKILQQIIS